MGMYRIHNCTGTSRNFYGLVQLEWSLVPWESGVVKHLATHASGLGFFQKKTISSGMAKKTKKPKKLSFFLFLLKETVRNRSSLC